MAKRVRVVEKGNPITATSLTGSAGMGHHARSFEVKNERSNCKVKTAFWRGSAHWHFAPMGKVEDDR